MSLFQDPVKALDQIEWYLENRDVEQFPGAFFAAAGNLSRRVLEQILFILAFYSGMPKNRYIRSNGQLLTAHPILQNLQRRHPSSGHSYLELARRRGPRIRKFARHPRSLNRWRRLLNEPSHFRNPAANPKAKERDIHEFVVRCRSVFDNQDAILIAAAMNELRSGGKVRAILSAGSENSPGIETVIVLRPSNIHVNEDGRLECRTPTQKMRVLPNDREVPNRWSSTPVALQGSEGLVIQARLVTEWGDPVDLTNMGTFLSSLARTADGRRMLEGRLKRLGFEIEFRASE